MFGLFGKKLKHADPSVKGDVFSSLDPDFLASIVPVVKVVEYAESTAHLDSDLKAIELSDDNTPVSRVLAGDLIVMYAEDRADCFAYLSKKRVRELGLDLDDLHTLAVENLPDRVPNVEIRGDGHCFMITAGGNFEASLLLHPTLWDTFAEHLQGSPIVAVPARDLLFVAGSESEQGRAFVKKNANILLEDKRYALSKRIFIRQNGAWSVDDLNA